MRASRQTILPLWGVALGLDPATIGLVYAVSGAVDMLLFYPAGRLMDQRGRRWAAVPAMTLLGLAHALLPLTGGLAGLMLAGLLMGVGNGLSAGLVMTVGADVSPAVGRLFKYDVTGGRYEEADYFAQGSGGKDARDSLKKRFKRDMVKDDAVRVAIEALIDAADEDLGTGGPDLIRGIFPTVKTITRSGIADLPDDDVRRHCEAVLNDRGRL